MNKKLNLSQGSGKRFFDRPVAAIQTQPKGNFWNIKMFCPFSNRSCLSSKGNLYSISPISRLLLPCRPSAVFFAVVPIIVNAFDRSIQSAIHLKMFLIGSIHIFFEFLKRFPKAFDTASAIKRIFFKVLFITDPIDSKPYSIKTCMRKAMRFSQKQVTTSPRTKNLLWSVESIKFYSALLTGFNHKLIL